MKKKRIIAVSGMSGGGKSTTAKALEDLGYFVVDNLPVQLLEKVILLAEQSGSEIQNLAFIIDVREMGSLKKFPVIWSRLSKSGYACRLLFLDASDDTLIHRFKETRRRHPLDQGDGVRNSIARERVFLKDVRALADEVIVSDGLNVHSLKEKIKEHFASTGKSVMQLTLLSFGFKYGVPPETDLCFDARFLRNPHFVDKLRQMTGLEESVQKYVLASHHAKSFVKRIKGLLEYLVPLFHKEGKSYLTVAIGCTGGQHRSPALVAELERRLRLKHVHIRMEHRDIER